MKKEVDVFVRMMDRLRHIKDTQETDLLTLTISESVEKSLIEIEELKENNPKFNELFLTKIKTLIDFEKQKDEIIKIVGEKKFEKWVSHLQILMENFIELHNVEPDNDNSTIGQLRIKIE